MSGRFERFDVRPGGSYRLVLSYADASSARGKATAVWDIVEARFVDVVPGMRVVQAVDFVSDDPTHAGTMTMTWEVTALVDIRADDVPPVIDRTEVRMESVLACLLLWNTHEQQARHPIRSRPDLELVRGVADDNPAQDLGSPSAKRDRIVSVDDDLLPNEIQVALCQVGRRRTCLRAPTQTAATGSSKVSMSGTPPAPPTTADVGSTSTIRNPQRVSAMASPRGCAPSP
jgi:hypothetical protein